MRRGAEMVASAPNSSHRGSSLRCSCYRARILGSRRKNAGATAWANTSSSPAIHVAESISTTLAATGPHNPMITAVAVS
jgi:hypothetical protein